MAPARSALEITAGSVPNTRPVTTETTSVNARTPGSTAIWPVRVVKRATNRVSIESVEAAKNKPKTPAASESRTLSTRSCRASCQRPAPSALRIAISRSRRSSRASIRFATFAQAISSTSAVVPSRISSSGRALRVSSSPSPSVVDVTPAVGRYTLGRSCVNRLQIASTSALAAGRETPGRSRPNAVRIENARGFSTMRFSAAARNGHAEAGM